MSSNTLRIVTSTLALAGALTAADPVLAQDPMMQQPQPQVAPQPAVVGGIDAGQLALGAVGPSIAGRIGYGGAVAEIINPFGVALGLEFAFAGYNVPLFVSAEFDYYLGEKFGGSRISTMHALAWFGYNRAIGTRFVLRPAAGAGLEILTGDADSLTGILIGFQGHGLFFLTDQLYLDAILRATFSIYSAESTGGSYADGLFGVQFLLGAGYAF